MAMVGCQRMGADTGSTSGQGRAKGCQGRGCMGARRGETALVGAAREWEKGQNNAEGLPESAGG